MTARAPSTRRVAAALGGGLLAAALALWAGLFAAPRPAWSGPSPHFASVSLEVDGPITEAVDRDVDGDGLADLILVSGRKVRVHRHHGEGVPFLERPEQSFRFDRRAIVFDVADLDRDGSAELVTIAEDGVFYHAWQGRPDGGGAFSLRRPRLVPGEAAGVLERPTRDEVRWKDLVRDLDGDGAEDLLLPGLAGYDLWRNEATSEIGLAGPSVLPVPLGASVRIGSPRPSSRITHTYWYPEPVSGDLSGGGEHEVIVAHDDSVLVYGIDAETRAARLAFEIDLSSVRRVGGEKKGLFDLDRSLPTRIVDVDADGVLDVVTTHLGEGVTTIYRGGRGRDASAYETPDHIVRSGGISFYTDFRDVDGDGRTDLLLARTAQIGALRILSVLLTREVTVDALVFYGRPDGSWPTEPDGVREVTIPLLIRSRSGQNEGIKFGADVVVTLHGDHDGDGRLDLVTKVAPDRLGIFRMGPNRKTSKTPWTTVPIPSTEGYRFVEAKVVDLDGDPRSDLLLRYYSWDQDADRLVAVVSR